MREDIPVLCVSRRDELPKAAREAFGELEERLGSPRGRKFYGVFYPQEGEYRACVAVKPDDDPARLGLAEGVIAGGRYLSTKLRGEPEEVYAQIPPTFVDLRKAAAATADDSRPSVEFYRRHDEVILLLPVRG